MFKKGIFLDRDLNVIIRNDSLVNICTEQNAANLFVWRSIIVWLLIKNRREKMHVVFKTESFRLN